MARMKKTPRYMRQKEKPKDAVPKDGNKQQALTHQVLKIDKNGIIVVDEHGSLVRDQITEIYVWNKDHREAAKENKGVWTIAEADELVIFQNCRQNGAFQHWKNQTHKGWGVHVVGGTSTALTLGQDYQRKDVKVCKFVEGNKGLWHGYPINYRLEREDVICDTALFYWCNLLKIIDKSEIVDIKNKEESSLI